MRRLGKKDEIALKRCQYDPCPCHGVIGWKSQSTPARPETAKFQHRSRGGPLMQPSIFGRIRELEERETLRTRTSRQSRWTALRSPTCDKSTRRAKFRFSRNPNHRYDSHHPVSLERGVGHRHRTLGWDAVDAKAPCAERDRRAGKLRERSWNVLTSDAEAYGESVWTRCLKLVGVKSCGGAAGPTGPGRRFPPDDGDWTAHYSGVSAG